MVADIFMPLEPFYILTQFQNVMSFVDKVHITSIIKTTKIVHRIQKTILLGFF